ncbi:MAG: hypothetical protein IRZ32_14465 [Solirubrobacteraceae bacterium]|nr:hypothetical protein [Solirubrobacteraceae bacterium]
MTLRAAAVLALAAFVVHETRYLLVPDVHADAGHGYLAAVPALLGLAIALAAGRTLVALGRGERRAGRGPSWAQAAGALLAVHAGQELAERVLAGGGPLDAGALLVVPLCAAAGALVALALRRAERLLRDAPVPARAPRLRPVAAPVPLPPAAPGLRPPAVRLRHLAGRAPPAFGRP